MGSWEITSIEQADERLVEWLKTVTAGLPGPVSCSLGPPPAQPAGQGVSCYLLDLLENTFLTQVNHPPLQLTLVYLVTTWAEKPADAHALLNALVSAALQEGELVLDFHPPAPELWSGFNVLPQPCFMLHVLARLERPAPRRGPLVRKPLKVEVEPVVSLSGVVLGPGDLPIMDALVELPLMELTTRSGPDGRFYFAGVPGGGAKTRLVVKARGRQMELAVDQVYSEDKPLVIHFAIE